MLDTGPDDKSTTSAPRTEGASSSAGASPRFLVGHSYRELDEIFRGLSTPLRVEDKRLKGTIIALAGTSWLPRWVRRSIGLAIGALIPWSAKEFYGPQGSNIWFGFQNGLRFLHYNVSRRAGTDGSDVIWLDYNIERNMPPFRRVRGEMRALGPGVMLCRMQWSKASGYFTVSARSSHP